jgi:hypothetical protein
MADSARADRVHGAGSKGRNEPTIPTVVLNRLVENIVS